MLDRTTTPTATAIPGPATDALFAMVEAFANDDMLARGSAMRAIIEGRAAYWSTGTYHNQRSLIVREEANVTGLRQALATYADDSGPQAGRTIPLLAMMIPLNRAARSEMTAIANALDDRLARAERIANSRLLMQPAPRIAILIFMATVVAAAVVAAFTMGGL